MVKIFGCSDQYLSVKRSLKYLMICLRGYLRMSEHTTLASSLCPQLCEPGPLCGQENRSDSLPVHRKLSSQIVPLP